MILTPGQIDALLNAEYGDTVTAVLLKQTVDTLATYADIVQRVAEAGMETSAADESVVCKFCGASRDYGRTEPHAPDCLYLAARRLRGME
jgi:hypothetical protein